MEHWRQVVFSSVEIWWNVWNKYGETRRWQVCHRWWYGLWHRHRIEPFSKITIIHEQGEWSIANDVGTLTRRCNARHGQTFYDLVNVYVFDIGSICIHGKELLRQFAFHQKYRENLTLKQMFDISEKLILEQSDEIFGVSQISWEDSPWKQLSLFNDEEVISLSHAKGYVLSDSVLCFGKMNQNPTSNLVGKKNWVGSKIHNNTELWKLTESRWNSSGIFSQDSPHCSSSTESTSSWTEWATQLNSKDELSSCRCLTTSHGDLKTMNRNE